MDEKWEVQMLLHWPKRDVLEDELAPYPDLQQVDKQIKHISESIILNENIAQIDEKQFDINDFPMKDRIAQREFVGASDLILSGIEDIKVGRKEWEVFHASEMVVVGIYKRLKGVLQDDYNPYYRQPYRNLGEGDIINYKGKEVAVVRHIGAHLMKYHDSNGTFKPIFPSGFYFKLEGRKKYKKERLFDFNGDQLEMIF